MDSIICEPYRQMSNLGSVSSNHAFYQIELEVKTIFSDNLIFVKMEDIHENNKCNPKQFKIRRT